MGVHPLTGEQSYPDTLGVDQKNPDSWRWDPAPGSAGPKVPVPCGGDEADEDRSDQERLKEEGIAVAERHQILQAGRRYNSEF